jgi:hypothetical protein
MPASTTHQQQSQYQSASIDLRTSAARDRLRQQIAQNTLQSVKDQRAADKIMQTNSKQINQRFDWAFDDVLSAIRNPNQKSTRSRMKIHVKNKSSLSVVSHPTASSVDDARATSLHSNVINASNISSEMALMSDAANVANDLNPLLHKLRDGLNSGFVSVHDVHGAGLLSKIITTPNNAGDALSNRLRWNAFQMMLEYGANPACYVPH